MPPQQRLTLEIISRVDGGTMYERNLRQLAEQAIEKFGGVEQAILAVKAGSFKVEIDD